MMKKALILLGWLIGLFLPAVAQEDTSSIELDYIRIDVKDVSLAEDTAVIDLWVTSLLRGERDFRLNIFASKIEDSRYNEHFFGSVLFGRVFVSIEDRQNYLNYVLREDIPVSVQVRVPNWQKEYEKPQALRLVFEDSEEEGRFRELRIQL